MKNIKDKIKNKNKEDVKIWGQEKNNDFLRNIIEWDDRINPIKTSDSPDVEFGDSYSEYRLIFSSK